MTFEEYQNVVTQGVDYHKPFGFPYFLLGLDSVADKVLENAKKIISKNGLISNEDTKEIKEELGRILRYTCLLAQDLGLSLEEVAANNIKK